MINNAPPRRVCREQKNVARVVENCTAYYRYAALFESSWSCSPVLSHGENKNKKTKNNNNNRLN